MGKIPVPCVSQLCILSNIFLFLVFPYASVVYRGIECFML